MKWKKGLAALLFASVALAACGAEEEATTEEAVEEQEVTIDTSKENDQYRTYITAQMPDFIADAQLLVAHMEEGKLAEAQKLFPLVTMYYERLQPLVGSLDKIDTAINGPIKEGKEANATGFAKLAHGLFVEQKTDGYVADAKKLVADMKSLEKQVAEVNLEKYNILDGTADMLHATINDRLTKNNVADTELYAVKAQSEAVEELVKIFMARADAAAAAEVVEATAALNDVLAFYEIGKEDYIKYSLFTNAQKAELTDAVKAVDRSFLAMVATIQ